MELFKVTCVTCRARLSVRDAALVGQIVACPRCGMMVQVTAPPAAAGGADQPNVAVASPVRAVAAATATAAFKTIEVPAPATLSGPAVKTSGPPDLPSAINFEDPASVLGSDENSVAAATGELAAPPIAAPAATAATSRIVAYRFAGMILGGAIAGTALVVGAIAWLGDGASDAPAAVADEGLTTSAASPQEAATEPPPEVHRPDGLAPADGLDAAAASSPAELPAATEPFAPPEAYVEIDAGQPPAPPAPASAEPPDVERDEVAAGAGEATAADEIAAPPPVVEPAPTETMASVADQPTPPEAPRLRIDPLDMDPEGLDLASLYGKRSDDQVVESQLPSDQPATGSLPPAASEAGEQPAAASQAAQVVRRDAMAGVGAPAASAPLLARKIPGVKITQMPLGRLLDFAGQASGLPVSAPPRELRMAGVSAATPVSVEVADATIEQLLAAALKPLRLAPVVADDQIMLHRIGEDKRRTVDYAVEDIAQTPAEIEQLAAWIEQLIEPASWQKAGGTGMIRVDSGKIHVEQAESVQYDVLVMLERYRLARGLAPRSKYPAALLTPTAPTLTLSEKLGGPAAFTFTEYTPLVDVFRYWEQELDVAILVDWPALAGERLWPEARIACSAADKPWSAALDEVLGPMGLAWRAVDGGTLQITSSLKVEGEPALEVYRLSAAAPIGAEQLKARLLPVSGDAADGRAATLPAIGYDAKSRVLLISQPAGAHRRMVAELGDLLEKP